VIAMNNFKSKLLLTSLFTVFVTFACGAATAQAEPIKVATLTAPIEAGTANPTVRAKPEAGGRVSKTSHEAACGVSKWTGSAEQGTPAAGGRTITRSDMGTCGVSTWPGSSAQAKPEAGGRVITRAEDVAEAPTPQQRSLADRGTSQ
jgi:hypothetical protein